ncbi:unnamed protein product [Adineta steineri]|uniref:G-protein coupled receptors family 1 profile domain-containing protein n=1 Tax=Adineta steineri TaxID=433720 RepID=A0A815MJQ2_9BILA|nr:unnamed protein product [Adineta steineri]
MALDITSIYSALFLILLTITIPSIICSIYIVYHFIRSQELRKRLNNHIIVVLVLFSFIQPGLGLFDWFCNVFGPIIVGTVATMILIIRVILQKHRIGQRAIWQRNRKMVIQLASLSTMYIAVWIPDIISYVIPIIVSNPLALDLASNVFCYFEYLAALLCPFVCLVGLPEVRQSIRQIFIRFNTVQPTFQNPVGFLRP